ncbi:hypothetical protein T492DRAFT_885123 [Pavlovales sp. CCMP2436]|nr:hypothetical protein T492DRAFT_885123 [Pavlovales sp. CCMP2436]
MLDLLLGVAIYSVTGSGMLDLILGVVVLSVTTSGLVAFGTYLVLELRRLKAFDEKALSNEA